MTEILNMNKNKVIEAPKDTILDGVTLQVYKSTWREHIQDPKSIDKFDEADKDLEIAVIDYECHFNGKGVKGQDTYRYYDEPSSNSKLGKFLVKYTDLKAGIKIKVHYDGKGIGRIVLE